MSAGSGGKAIIAALLANLGIAIAKFVAFVFTGSSSMLAESVHSVADTSNQGLLLLGGKRARRAQTRQHPFGYGRERYFYAFAVSVVLFTVGSVFSLYEGWHKISDPHPIDSPVWAFGVLSVAVVLESFSFRTAIVESNHVRANQSWVAFVRRAKAPELPVVLLEDLAALLGLIFALVGVSLAVVTHNALWDGIGTMAIGALLGAVAIILAIETKSLLIGESARPEIEDRIVATLEETPGVDRIIHLKTLHLGPEELMVAAKVAVSHDDSAAEIARCIDAAEGRIRDAVPLARVIYLEPDLYRRQPEEPETAQTPCPDLEAHP